MENVQLSDQRSFIVIQTKMKLDLHADTCVVCDQCLAIHDHNRTVSVSEYNPKAVSKSACIIDAIVAYDEPETGQAFILFTHQAIEIRVLNIISLSHVMLHKWCCNL